MTYAALLGSTRTSRFDASAAAMRGSSMVTCADSGAGGGVPLTPDPSPTRGEGDSRGPLG
jgi:hypothetical protein